MDFERFALYGMSDSLDPSPRRVVIMQCLIMPLKCHRMAVLRVRNGNMTFSLLLRGQHRYIAQPEREDIFSRRLSITLLILILLFLFWLVQIKI
jgi:hypothetical protein